MRPQPVSSRVGSGHGILQTSNVIFWRWQSCCFQQFRRAASQSLQGNVNGLLLVYEPRNLSSSRPQPGDVIGAIIWALQFPLCSSWHENKGYIPFTKWGGLSTLVVLLFLLSFLQGFLCTVPGIRHPLGEFFQVSLRRADFKGIFGLHDLSGRRLDQHQGVTVHGSALQLCLHYVSVSGRYPHRLDELHRV